MQYFLIDFVSTISLCIVCAICFYGVGLSYIVLTILTMMTAFPHIAIIYHIYCINWIINIIECALWVPEFFGYDVSFVDVVKFDYRNFYIKFYVLILVYIFLAYFIILFTYYVCYVIQFCLILADVTAIGIRLSHASRTNLDSWRTAQ